jgi:hypothetical protein
VSELNRPGVVDGVSQGQQQACKPLARESPFLALFRERETFQSIFAGALRNAAQEIGKGNNAIGMQNRGV